MTSAVADSPFATKQFGGVAVLDWLPEEIAAWEMPELIPTSEWVERHLRIPSRDAAIPGPIDLNVTPYLRGPFDAVDDPRIEIITMVCATQVGKSIFLHGSMMSLTAQRPGPILMVLPTEPDAREVAGGTLKSMVLECEPLMNLTVAGETSLTKEGFAFTSASWYFAWSNSAASLARRACRYVFFDEGEKYPLFVGRESDPIRLGDARLRTFRYTTGCKSTRVSSPTTEDGLIGRSWSASDQRRYWVPCPECGTFQVLIWTQVGWPHDKSGHSVDADTIREEDLAWYECIAPDCEARWTDVQRYAAVRKGVWAKEGQTVDRSSRNGRVRGQAKRPRSRHAGFHISALYSSFVKLAQLAAEWIECKHYLAGLMAFVNQELGEFWIETEVELKEEPLRKHVGAYAMGTAPEGVQVVTAFIDVHHGWFAVESRGWGYGLESWMLDYRVIETEEQLRDHLVDMRFPRVDDAGKLLDERNPANAPLAIRTAGIDSGDQTAYVYNLVQDWRDLDLKLTKGGDITGAMKVRSSPIARNPRTRKAFRHVMMLYTFDANFFKDTAARLAQVEKVGPGYLHLPAGTPDVWFRQFASERKVPDRKRGRAGRSGTPRRIWKPKGGHRPNHAWDCGVGNCVLADQQLLNLRSLPNPEAPPTKPKRRRVGRMNGFGR